MPAGVTFGQYIRFTTAAFLAMAAGSQFVHTIYRPLDGLEDLIAEKERQLRQEIDNENAKKC